MTSSTTLSAALGGSAAILAAVEAFYQHLLADRELAPSVRQSVLTRLAGRQRGFAAAARRACRARVAGRGATPASAHPVIRRRERSTSPPTCSRPSPVGHARPPRPRRRA